MEDPRRIGNREGTLISNNSLQTSLPLSEVRVHSLRLVLFPPSLPFRETESGTESMSLRRVRHEGNDKITGSVESGTVSGSVSIEYVILSGP